MNIKKRLIIIVLIVLSLIYLMTKNVLGYSFTTSLEPSSSTVAKGGTVDIKINLSGINAGDGLYNFSAVLNYDNTVFEDITESSIVEEASAGWKRTYSADTKKLLLDNASYVKDNQTIATIKLKVKSEVQVESSTFGLTEVKAANMEGEIQGKEISTVIQIGEGEGAIPVTNEAPADNNPIVIGDDNSSVDENFANEVNNLVDDDNTSNSDVPYTGMEDYIVPLIAVVIVLGVISFINYKKLDPNK